MTINGMEWNQMLPNSTEGHLMLVKHQMLTHGAEWYKMVSNRASKHSVWNRLETNITKWCQ